MTLSSRNKEVVPFSIGKRDINAGTLVLEVDFNDPEGISADSHELDMIEIKPARDLIATRGLKVGGRLLEVST